MTLQVLLSTINEDKDEILKMNITSSLAAVCQCGKNGDSPPFYYSNSIGVGNSRNLAIEKSSADILLFTDDDMIYSDRYEKDIINEFESHPNADMIIFNVNTINKDRPFAHTNEFTKVSAYGCFKYGTPQIAVKKIFVDKHKLRFSTQFGGGAEYSAGEDNLFILTAIKNGGSVYASPITIGTAGQLKSTWFNGYNEKYFYDKGAFYKAVSDKIYPLFITNYVLRHSETLKEIGAFNAVRQMLKGAKKYKKQE